MSESQRETSSSANEPLDATTRYSPVHVHDGEWCAKCVEHGVVEEVRRNQRDPIADAAPRGGAAMNERERLAADLTANTPTFGDGQFSESWWREYADRLIALGWTRLDEARLRNPCRVCGQPAVVAYTLCRTHATNPIAVPLAAYREDTDAD